MLSGFIGDEVEMPVRSSFRVADDSPNGHSFDEMTGNAEAEIKEAEINEYNFEEKGYSTYDLDSESLW
jgi:hypothetical protein